MLFAFPNILTKYVKEVKQNQKAGADAPAFCVFLGFAELILANQAQGALEILRNILPLGAGGNTALGVTELLIVFPAADIANIFHNEFLLKSSICFFLHFSRPRKNFL